MLVLWADTTFTFEMVMARDACDQLLGGTYSAFHT